MAITLKCHRCRHICRFHDSAAGTTTKCPNCHHVLQVPQPESPAEKPSTPPAESPKTPAEASQKTHIGTSATHDHWYVRTPAGETYGPIARSELEDWLTEGRLAADFKIAHKGQSGWKLAAELFPQLRPASPAAGGIEIASSPAHHHPFHRRQYPAMTFVMYAYYVLAGLACLSFLVFCVLLTQSAGSMPGGSRATTAVIIVFLLNLLIHLGVVCTFIFLAETIKIILDIQANTQETAHHARHTPR